MKNLNRINHQGFTKKYVLQQLENNLKADNVDMKQAGIEQTKQEKDFTHLMALNDNDFISTAYRELLGREPDSEGFATFQRFMYQGMPREAMIYLMTKSLEFAKKFKVRNIKIYKKKYRKFLIKTKIKRLPIIGWLIKLRRMPDLIAEMRIWDIERRVGEQVLRENIEWLKNNVIKLHEKFDVLNYKADGLNEKVDSLYGKVNGLYGLYEKVDGLYGLHGKTDSLHIKTDSLQYSMNYINYYEIYEVIKKINKKIQDDNNQNIIPIIIDCEYLFNNCYLEPIIHELFKITEQKFDIFYGELNNGDGASLFCYNKENAFPVSFYSKIEGNTVFLSPHIHQRGPESALKLLFDHGICSAKHAFNTKERYKNFDIHCVSGELFENKISNNLYKYGLQDTVKLINGGYPKSDELFQGTLPSNKEIFSRLKLDSRKKTLLYAPSWDKGLSLREFGVSLVDTILQNNEYNLIVKLHATSFTPSHHKDYIHYTGGINWEEQFIPYLNNPNFAFVKEYNINELLMISDIMITDLSSVAFEFLVLDKPVIYLDCPKFEEIFETLYKPFNDYSYKELLDDPYSNAGRHVGFINYDHKDILKDISFIINNPDYKLNERKEYSEKILSNKGCASKFYANMIVSKYYEHS